VSLHPGRAGAGGLVFEGELDAPVGISRWSQAYLQYALHEAVRTGALARDAGLFTDVDFSTAEGRATLPESSAVYTPSAAAKFFDISKARSPLLPFADTVSSMLAFIHAAVVSRRNAEMRVTSGFAAMEVPPKAAKAAAGEKASAAGKKRHASSDPY
jgi:hypothetical protein